MAVISSGSVEMHIHKVEDWKPILRGETDGIVERLANGGYHPYLLFVHMKDIVTTTAKASTPHTTDTEIFPADAKLGLGGGTAVNVILVSDDNSDDGIVYIMGWGVDGNGNDNLIAEEITLTGKSRAFSTRKFYEVYHMYALKTVSGNVTLEYPAATPLLTITTGKTHSNGSGFTVPLGWQCRQIFVDAKAFLGAVGALIIYRGGWFVVKKIEEDSDGNANGNQDLIWYRCFPYESAKLPNKTVLHRHKDSNANELRIEHHACYENEAVTVNGLFAYVLWKQTITETLTS